MGGSGSTRWNSHSRRWTAEDCLKLSIFDLRRLIGAQVFVQQRPYASVLIWTRRNGSLSSSVGYSLVWVPVPRLALRYRPHGVKDELICTVGLQSTPCNYGRVRWWFTCPRCKRRVGVLFYRRSTLLHIDEWACWKCQDLTYTSAQEAHLLDRGGSPYMALAHLLTKLWKIDAMLEKHPRGRKAEKAWQEYEALASRLERVNGLLRGEQERRYAEVAAAIERTGALLPVERG